MNVAGAAAAGEACWCCGRSWVGEAVGVGWEGGLRGA